MAMPLAATPYSCALCAEGRRGWTWLPATSASSSSSSSSSSSASSASFIPGVTNRLRSSASSLSLQGSNRLRANVLYTGRGVNGSDQKPPIESLSSEEIVVEGKTQEEQEEEEEGKGVSSAVLGLITPIRAIKWATIGAFSLTLARLGYTTFTSPSFWTYASWFMVIWPLPTAMALGFWSLLLAVSTDMSMKKKIKVKKERDAKKRDQFIMLAGALTWLILVPLGLHHGYIEGWPLTLFFIYMYFFLISAIVRYGRYGELNPKPRENQWSSSPSRIAQIAFLTAIVLGHWIAAFEGPNLYFTWNWQLPSQISTIIIALSIVLHYSATYFLSKYSDKIMKPMAIVVFGPYRFVRHPIYASYMLLFAGYSIALRAYWSMALLVVASLLYYRQRAKLEENMLEEAFPGQYLAYKEKVKYKFFWLVY